MESSNKVKYRGGKSTAKGIGIATGRTNNIPRLAITTPGEVVEQELKHVKLHSSKHKDGKPLDQVLANSTNLKKPNFCSVKTPWRRRLQTLAVAWHVGSFVYILAFAILALANPIMWVIMIPYMVYYAIDRSPANGNVTKRYSPWVRSLGFWRYYCDYYPITLHKTADLPPTYTAKTPLSVSPKSPYRISFKVRIWPFKYSLKFNILKRTNTSPELEMEATGPRYIFGYHPHGVGALGAFGAFATEGANFSQMYPGIRMCLMTLINQFQIPFYRDYLLALGITAVSKKNALRVLQCDHSICIVVGGAQEALMSKIGSADLVLKKRKGFIKLALETGNVSLVPCFAFGETDCYNILQTDEKSYLRRLQLWVKRSYGFTIPFFFARGLFNYDFGLIPFRRPINVVTGAPIHVKEKHENPTVEEIDHYHKLYIEELERIFFSNRKKFGYENQELKYVE
ncbi:LAME_0F12420g1_1 [Lachancea meyersii CBS 8951]|uniref:Diacylglycerol O-acyltransferase n=1 Tax=Lachancea meyersii CBS 8951 TaxID=1266667 RepID=A0A1G4JWS6_9SACH|nr:LAME_0F12420g1_1 [Lachancea meyersii CBS 8951]